MYEYLHDPETGGLLLTDRATNFSKEPRPVYAPELDALGLDSVWKYAKQTKTPYMWAEASRYYYRGEHVFSTVGGALYQKPGIEFVYKKDVKKNILYVAKAGDEELLYSDSCYVDGINWVGPKPTGPIEVGVKFRYRQPDQFCTLTFEGERVRLDYHAPVKAVTPGQIAVFYDGERMLGGGIIEETYYKGKRTDI